MKLSKQILSSKYTKIIRNFSESSIGLQKTVPENFEVFIPVLDTTKSLQSSIKDKIKYKRLALASIVAILPTFYLVPIPIWPFLIYFAGNNFAKRRSLKKMLGRNISKIEISSEDPKKMRFTISAFSFEFETKSNNLQCLFEPKYLREKVATFRDDPYEPMLNLSIELQDASECKGPVDVMRFERMKLNITYVKDSGDYIDLDELMRLISR